MNVVILCGGLGTRLREETEFRPKPMVEIGGRPILWHIMRHYASYGHREFVLCLGYRGEVIREYFLNYRSMNNAVRIELGSQRVEHLEDLAEEADWRVTLVDTGLATSTAGRLLRIAPYVRDGAFLCTYGDGLSNVDLHRLVAFHEMKGKAVSVTGVRPQSRFGELIVRDGLATEFQEKPQLSKAWVSSGFFVIEPGAFAYMDDDAMFERGALPKLASAGELAVYEHAGYWQSMDTYRDMQALNEEWATGRPGWRERP